jgi:hypothetical protein
VKPAAAESFSVFALVCAPKAARKGPGKDVVKSSDG